MQINIRKCILKYTLRLSLFFSIFRFAVNVSETLPVHCRISLARILIDKFITPFIHCRGRSLASRIANTADCKESQETCLSTEVTVIDERKSVIIIRNGSWYLTLPILNLGRHESKDYCYDNYICTTSVCFA